VNNIYLLIAAIGLTFILKYGFIFESSRNFIKNKAININITLGLYIEKLLSCAQCLGFWSGFTIFLLTGILEQTYNLVLYYSILFGFISSFMSYLFDLVTEYIDERIYKLKYENEQKDFKKD
jgi:ABC-type dipeptide/oligopeptide/nickel transport system permease component